MYIGLAYTISFKTLHDSIANLMHNPTMGLRKTVWQIDLAMKEDVSVWSLVAKL